MCSIRAKLYMLHNVYINLCVYVHVCICVYRYVTSTCIVGVCVWVVCICLHVLWVCLCVGGAFVGVYVCKMSMCVCECVCVCACLFAHNVWIHKNTYVYIALHSFFAWHHIRGVAAIKK